jgi:hypothetical protein
MGLLISGSDASSMVDNTDADTGEGTQTEEGEQNSDKL